MHFMTVVCGVPYIHTVSQMDGDHYVSVSVIAGFSKVCNLHPMSYQGLIMWLGLCSKMQYYIPQFHKNIENCNLEQQHVHLVATASM